MELPCPQKLIKCMLVLRCAETHHTRYHRTAIYIYIYITYYISHITYYILPIDCLSIALDAHMLSHNGYGPGPGPRAQKGPSSRSELRALFEPWAHIQYGLAYGHQGQAIGNQ